MSSKLNQMDVEIPEVSANQNRSRVNRENNKNEDVLYKEGVNIMDFIEPKKSSKREAVSVYFDEEIMNKLKTVSEKTNVAISKMIEKSIIKLTKDIEIDEAAVKAYNKNNKRKTKKEK